MTLHATPMSASAAPAGSNAKPTTPNQKSKDDPERMLRSALDAITLAFERKGTQNASEVAHWKQVASGQRHQIVNIETELNQLRKRVGEYEKVVANLEMEKTALQVSKQSVLDKYNHLRRNAMQLETFRKQIASMVQGGPNSILLQDAEASFIEMNAVNNHNAGQQGLYNAASIIHAVGAIDGDTDDHAMMGSFANDEFIKTTPSRQPTNSAPGAAAIGETETLLNRDNQQLETLHLTPFKSEDHLPQQLQQQTLEPDMEELDRSFVNDAGRTMMNSPVKRRTKTTTGVAATGTEADQSMDAPTLYKRIRSVLTPQQFDTFATAIAQFNSGLKSAADTIGTINQLVKEPHLIAQMKNLIMRAIAETSQDFSVHHRHP